MMSPPRAPFLTSSMASSGNARRSPSSMASSSTSPCSCWEPCAILRCVAASSARTSSSFFCSSALSSCAFSCSWVRAAIPARPALPSTCFCTSSASASFLVLELLALLAQGQLLIPHDLHLRVTIVSCTFMASSCGLNACSVRAAFPPAPWSAPPLFLEQTLHILELARAALACSAASCSARACRGSPLLFLQCRQGAGAGRLHRAQGLLGEPLLQRKFLLACGAGDSRVGGE